MPELLRVKDKDTGYIRTIGEHELPHGNYQVLKQDAVNAVGDPLPPEFPDSTESSATEKKEQRNA